MSYSYIPAPEPDEDPFVPDAEIPSPVPTDPVSYPTGPSSNVPVITITPETNDPDSYNQASNVNKNRSYHIITPEKLRSTVLDFPDNPNAGDEYVKHNIQYTYSGTHWEANNARLFVDRFTRYDISSYGELP